MRSLVSLIVSALLGSARRLWVSLESSEILRAHTKLSPSKFGRFIDIDLIGLCRIYYR